MRALVFSSLFIVFGVPALAQVDSRVSMELFARDVHPFLIKNCAECHNGAAIYPSGPPHAHNDPSVAFGAFIRRINFANPEKSSMLTMSKNQHFCNDYGSCKDAQFRSTEGAQKIMQYISSVKSASLSASSATAREAEVPPNAEPFRRVFHPMKHLRTQSFKVRSDVQLNNFFFLCAQARICAVLSRLFDRVFISLRPLS